MPTASSPKPAVVKFNDESYELEWVIDLICESAQTQKIGVLLRDRGIIKELVCKLKQRGIYAQILKRDMPYFKKEADVSVGTYYSAKGLEFDMAILPYCSYERLPSQERIESLENREEALREEIKLLYVAVTRAKDRLIITYTNEKTELLPDNMGFDDYYDEVNIDG